MVSVSSGEDSFSCVRSQKPFVKLSGSNSSLQLCKRNMIVLRRNVANAMTRTYLLRNSLSIMSVKINGREKPLAHLCKLDLVGKFHQEQACLGLQVFRHGVLLLGKYEEAFLRSQVTSLEIVDFTTRGLVRFTTAADAVHFQIWKVWTRGFWKMQSRVQIPWVGVTFMC